MFASEDPEDLTLLPTPQYKSFGSYTVMAYDMHYRLNPPDAPSPFTLGSDTQLFRDDPCTVSQVLNNWAEYAAPKEESQLERNRKEFKLQLDEHLATYSRLLAKGDHSGADCLRNDLLIMIDAAQASGQTEGDASLRETVESVRYALAA